VPERWAEYADPVPQPAMERLDDSLWEVDRCRAGDLPAEVGRLERVRGEIERLARFIYDRPCILEDLLRARELRHTPAILQWIGYPFMRGVRPPAADDKSVPQSRHRPEPRTTSSPSFRTSFAPGDRITTSAGRELEVTDHPESYRQGKMVRVNLREPGTGPVVHTQTWPAHERVQVRRGSV